MDPHIQYLLELLRATQSISARRALAAQIREELSRCHPCRQAWEVELKKLENQNGSRA